MKPTTSKEIAEKVKDNHSSISKEPDFWKKKWLSADEVEILKMNNCKLCHARIFLTSSGLAECKEGCLNWLRPLAYISKEIWKHM